MAWIQNNIKEKCLKKKKLLRTFLVVQWLRLCAILQEAQV